MNLAFYLTELLKTNDCVIIPDLGGFIANYQSSQIDEQVDQFSPPSREIIFSGKLKKNDGLLVNYISEHEGVGYLEARKIVSEFVAETISKLENGEKVEFVQLGTIYFDQNENLLFDASQNKNIRTDAFGLESFHFPQLVNKYNQTPKPVFRDKDPEPQSRRKPVLKYALLVVPVIAAFYFIPKFISREPATQLPVKNEASLIISDAPAQVKTEVAVPAASVPTEEKLAAHVSVKEIKEAINEEDKLGTAENKPDHTPVVPANVTPKVSKPEKAIEQPIINIPSRGKFHVVGGCFKVKENADKLVERLIRQGYHAQVSNLGKDFYRVSVESFQTRNEAVQALAKLLDAEPENGYWLMVDKR